MTKGSLQKLEAQKLISLPKQTWCKICDMYYDPVIFVEHMLKAHQEVVTEQKEEKKQDENYWICPIHKKSLTKFGRCEMCGSRIIVMIRKKEYNSWLKEMQIHNDHVHQWIKSQFSDYWFDFHCLFCNNKPQEVGIHELQEIFVDYQGKEVKIDSN